MAEVTGDLVVDRLEMDMGALRWDGHGETKVVATRAPALNSPRRRIPGHPPAVPAKCFCALLMSERSFYDNVDFPKSCLEQGGIGKNVGCIQIGAGIVMDVVKKIKKCKPGLLSKINPNPDGMTKPEIHLRLTHDCKWASEIAALRMLLTLDPKCNGAGVKGSCRQAYRDHNNSDSKNNLGPEIRKRAACIEAAFGRNSPC